MRIGGGSKMSDLEKEERDRIICENLGRSRKYEGQFSQRCSSYIASVQVPYRERFLVDPLNEFLNSSKCGLSMENANDLLKAINVEVEESKKILQHLSNDITALSDIVQPKLIEQIKELRSSRMAIVNEVRDALNSMKEIRKFFLDSDYSSEMDRIERFVSLCKEMRTLKSDGTLDAISDISIRLAIKEESTYER